MLKASGLFVLCLFLAGCMHKPYTYFEPAGERAPEAPVPVRVTALPAEQIARGERYSIFDNVSSWTFGLFSKLILWNLRVDNHEISPETEEAVRQYLIDNQLTAVKVRLNEYAPLDEWSRLFKNDSVGLGWRLTLGLLSELFYTVLPGRLFGGDNYNPYSDTISLYSDHKAIALHEAGHAKDFAGREWKGSYAFLQIVPLASLFSESEATGDALGYLDDQRKRKEEREAYFILYPAYATYIGGEFVNIASIFTNISRLIALVPVIPAHAVGRIKGNRVDAEDDPALILLREKLHSSDAAEQTLAAKAIGEFGPSARSALPDLQPLLAHENADVRECAEAAIDAVD